MDCQTEVRHVGQAGQMGRQDGFHLTIASSSTFDETPGQKVTPQERRPESVPDGLRPTPAPTRRRKDRLRLIERVSRI
jgi:hypothetical protein